MSDIAVFLFLIVIALSNAVHNSHSRGHTRTVPLLTNNTTITYDYSSSVVDIDNGIQYGYILPYIDEWDSFWKPKNGTFELSPFQFWFKCIENEVRGYFFLEDLRVQNHAKEATIFDHGHLGTKVKLTADGIPIKLFRIWHGGGDFFFDIPPNTPSDHVIDIEMKGFRHYTRFKVANCAKKKPRTEETKYIMHIHLRDFSKPSEFRPAIIDGVANHMAYHRCALNLHKYEVVIQREHLNVYLQNEKIAHAVQQGWITFVIRNPINPAPLHERNSPSNCYYQAYTQNMALLHHWQENVKIYFWDSDEYMATDPDMTPRQFMHLVENGTAVGFKRRMVFCSSCDTKHSEALTMSLTKSELSVHSHVLRDPKLVVDPNRVGCYIVHWAGCGDKSENVPLDKAYILHFENFYYRRWDMTKRQRFGNETIFKPASMQKICDPTLYNWKNPLPSFHA